jgi:hypothetical protein
MVEVAFATIFTTAFQSETLHLASPFAPTAAAVPSAFKPTV